MTGKDAVEHTAEVLRSTANATNVASALALQAGNYSRAVSRGTPHDAGEARRIVATAQSLVDAIEGTHRIGAQGR